MPVCLDLGQMSAPCISSLDTPAAKTVARKLVELDVRAKIDGRWLLTSAETKLPSSEKYCLYTTNAPDPSVAEEVARQLVPLLCASAAPVNFRLVDVSVGRCWAFAVDANTETQELLSKKPGGTFGHFRVEVWKVKEFLTFMKEKEEARKRAFENAANARGKKAE